MYSRVIKTNKQKNKPPKTKQKTSTNKKKRPEKKKKKGRWEITFYAAEPIEHTIDSSKCIDFDLPNYWINWVFGIAEQTKPRETVVL